jgi:hypothetical protein
MQQFRFLLMPVYTPWPVQVAMRLQQRHKKLDAAPRVLECVFVVWFVGAGGHAGDLSGRAMWHELSAKSFGRVADCGIGLRVRGHNHEWAVCSLAFVPLFHPATRASVLACRGNTL